jgi:tRNA threonylcarbamoyl adenosine modification protein YeaZ
LAIETTGRLGSIAVLSGQQVVREANLDPDRRTAATLAPVIEETLNWCRNNQSFPDFLAVADGPGSFTGLRIGVTTAKTLGYALSLPVVAVDSLAAIAAATFDAVPASDSLMVGIDAYRGQVFSGEFRRSNLLPPIQEIPESWTPHPDSVGVISQQHWIDSLDQRSSDTGIAGDAKPMGSLADQRFSRRCDAIGVGLLGLRAAIQGLFVDPMQLIPRYLKLSAAEEKAADGQ